MDNLELLFRKNNEKCKKPIMNKRGVLECNIGSCKGLWTGNEVRQMISVSNYILKKYGAVKMPIHFVLSGSKFIDKLTYVFVECICLYLIQQGHPVQIFMRAERDIGVEGIESSPLLLLNATKIKSVKLYPSKFNKDLYGKHYRKVVDDKNVNGNDVGNVYTEIDTFLKAFDVSEMFRDKVALTIAELVGNATEHARSDCLIDIDVTTPYEMKGDKTNNHYYGVNIAVVSFSPKRLGDDVYQKIIASTFEIEGRYAKVKDAYEYHKKHFDDQYSVEDFCNITTFQHKISGRRDVFEGVGGTGLTKLIKSLQSMSEAYRCYVITGNRCVNFSLELLEYDSDGWIGFNDKNEYFEAVPNPEVTTECLINMPGTAYNLNFITKGCSDYE